jgi:hypothetical protein
MVGTLPLARGERSRIADFASGVLSNIHYYCYIFNSYLGNKYAGYRRIYYTKKCKLLS